MSVQRRDASSSNNDSISTSRTSCLSSAAPGVSVRRYLSEAGENEALRALKEQLHRQQRVTSDDVRQAVRAVARQEGAATLPPDFPPSRWVLEFKRLHGFVQFNSFAFGAAASGGGKAPFGLLPERLEAAPLRQYSLHDNNSTNAGAAQATGSSLSSGNNSDDEKEKEPSDGDSISPKTRRMVTYSAQSASTFPAPPGALHPSDEEQRQTQLQRSFSQYHLQFLLQQQRRAVLVNDHRRVAPRTVQDTAESVARDQEDMRSNWNRGTRSETGAMADHGNSPNSGSSSLPPHIRHSASINGSSVDDSLSNASSSTANHNDSGDKRGYRLSHTVPAETWEKAIAAVEQQGMSLRSAAKMYGVHFAALHRRVKKRAQGGLGKGNNGYFHQSDEAGIMRVVVARAELGVLMTFDELMRLVEAAALCKLPDLSVDSARKLLSRFQSRNEQSIRHLIDDWPPPRPATSSSGETSRPQHQPYLEHPGFSFGPKPPVTLRSSAVGPSTVGTKVAAMTAAAKTPRFVPPSRLIPSAASLRSQVDVARAPGVRVMSDNRGLSPSGRLLFVGPRARSEGDGDAVMVV